jgi:hypothetical protein
MFHGLPPESQNIPEWFLQVSTAGKVLISPEMEDALFGKLLISIPLFEIRLFPFAI